MRMTRMSALVTGLLLPVWISGVASVTADDAVPPTGEDKAGSEGPRHDQDRPVFEGSVEVEGTPIVEGTTVTRHAVAVATVSERQIDDLNAQDLSSALRRVPGVVVSRYNLVGAFGGGDGGAVFIRGHGSGRPGSEIVTMVDGIPRFVGIWAHPLLDTLSLDPADHVDVYRSAQPVLFGNMAFGAVNLVSKRRVTPGSGGRVVGSIGSFDTSVARAEYGARAGALDWYVEAGRRASDGHRTGAGGEVEAVSGRLGYRLAPSWDISLQLHHTSGLVEDPGRVDLPPTPITPTYDTDDDFWLATLSHQHQGVAGSLKVYVDDLTADWLQWDAGAQSSFRSITSSRNRGVHWRETLVPWPGGEVVAGVDHDIYGGEFVERWSDGDRNPADLSFRNTAPYVMISQVFGGDVTVTPSVGVRYTSTRSFGDEWGGQAGLKIGLGRHVVYANLAHAFNLPGVWAAVQYGGWGRGEEWRDLEAETVDHVELGWLAALGPAVRLEVAVFRDDVSGALRFVPPPPPPPLFANVGDYTTRGIEVSVQVAAGRGVALYLGGTLSDTDPADVPNLPETTAVAGLAWEGASGWRVNFDAEHVGSRLVLNPRYATDQVAVDGSLLVNGRVAAPLDGLLGLSGELFVVGENLSDEAYQLRPGYPMPGRTWTVGLEVRLD